MTLHWAMDTENGGTSVGSYQLKDGTVCECGEDLKNRMVTYAPLGIRDFGDVRCLISKPDEDVYQKFHDKLVSSEPERNFVFHVWNLDWEAKPLVQWFHRYCKAEGLLFNDPKMNAGHMECVVTVNGWYSLEFYCKDCVMAFVDDNNHYHAKVKDAVKDLMKHEHWAEIMRVNGLEGKESKKVEKLHEIWYSYGEGTDEWNTYVHYAKVDAFCQALLMENLFDLGRFCTPRCFDGREVSCKTSAHTALSASGAGFRDAKSILIYGCRYKDIPKAMEGQIENLADRKNMPFDKVCSLFMGRFLDDKWTQHFGLLHEAHQVTVEKNLRGGFVYGKVGVYKGRFWHYDYKSSYPFEYAFCKLPLASWTEEVKTGEVDKKGRPVVKQVRRCIQHTTDLKQMDVWATEFNDDAHQIYVIATVKFKLKEGALPLITAKECVDDKGHAIRNYGGARAKKMVEGTTKPLLWTWEELQLVERLYDIIEEKDHEMWVCKAEWGFFKPAVELYFDGKETTSGVERLMFKLDLNGATHGRAMIKILTAEQIKMGDAWIYNATKKEGAKASIEDVQTNPLIGMTAMAHARVRLLNHCMCLKDAGYEIFMCDTDSMVTDCPPEVASALLEEAGWCDWVKHKFKPQFKGDKPRMDEWLGRLEIEQSNGVEMFDEFRCWGLKRYAEFCNGAFRKGAFAGMHKDDQSDMLSKEYNDTLHWITTGKKWCGECFAIRKHSVDVSVESIWYEATA